MSNQDIIKYNRDTCARCIFDKIHSFAMELMTQKLMEQEEQDSGTEIAPRMICFFTQRGFVKFMLSGSLEHGEPSLDLLPCIFESPSAENPEIIRQCVIPDNFEYAGDTDPEECMQLMQEWIEELAKFVESIDQGYASSLDGFVTGYSSTFEQDQQEFNENSS